MEKEDLYKLLEPIKPKQVFDQSLHPSRPDYNVTYNWAALPDIKGLQHEVPSESFTSITTSSEVDVFYIHPTGFFGKHWNCKIDKNIASYDRTELMLINQASAFNGSCNIYAPHYRQATYYSYFDINKDGFNAHDLAYQDVKNAFNYYLENFNNGKPFIIAAHSQGALHGQRLVHEHISQQPIRELFIAAYLIGYILPIKYFDQLYPDLIISNDAEDQSSIISWCTGTKDFRRSRAHSMLWLPDGWRQELMEQSLVCQNPFSWNTKSDWISGENNLSIRLKASNLFLADYYAKKHSHSDLTIDAINDLSFEARHSENSMIETQGPLIEKMKSFTTGGDLHNFDVSLFWGAIRQNVQRRAHAFKK